MKKTLALAILGSATMVNMAMAQGQIWFDNYSFAGYSPIMWSANPAEAPAGEAGAPFNGQIELSYSFNGGANTGVLPVIPVAGGYFMGGVVTIPGYAGGTADITLTPIFGTTRLAPGNGALTFPESLAISPTPPAFFSGLPANGSWVAIVPEPSTFALAGLGAAALLIFRRRA